MARKSRGCAEAYMGTASRSVEILPMPPPKAAATLAAAQPPAKAEKDPFRMETSLARCRPLWVIQNQPMRKMRLNSVYASSIFFDEVF